MLSHVPGLQTYNSKQPFSLVNGVAVQIYRQASKLTTSPGSLRLHIEITCDYITLQIYMRPAKRWGWKSQGSPFERFAWPCVFSSPVFNSLPAEIGNIRYTIFRDNAGLLRNLEDAVEFFAQRRHILSDLVVGDLGVNLGVVICLCPSIFDTVSNGTPCVSVTVVANVCRATWIVGLNGNRHAW